MAINYASGEKDKKLSKKNVSWYCNKLLEYAHDGLTLDFFLRDYYIRRTKWDKYVKKHQALQDALIDAKERAKGAVFEKVYRAGNIGALTNPTFLKMMAENQLGWGNLGGPGGGKDLSDQPPPTINFIRAEPLPHQLPGAEPPSLEKMMVQSTGELSQKRVKKKSNGGK